MGLSDLKKEGSFYISQSYKSIMKLGLPHQRVADEKITLNFSDWMGPEVNRIACMVPRGMTSPRK